MKKSLLSGLVFLVGAGSWAGSPITIQKSVNAGTDKTGERLVLADEQGLSLYTFAPDKPNESTCYDDCAQTWPPVLLDEDKGKALMGSLGITTRKDGTLQLTVDGRPVYLFIGDQKQGDIHGEGLGGVWFVIDLKLAK